MKTTVNLLEPGQYGLKEMNIGEMEAVNGGGLITDIVLEIQHASNVTNTYAISILNNTIAFAYATAASVTTYLQNAISINIGATSVSA